MPLSALGKAYDDGTCIVRQGERGDCMYVLQTGRVEVVLEDAEGEVVLSVLEPGDVFGEMALFTKEPRSATVRTCGEARILTIDRKTFLKRIHEDPSLGFQILKKMSERIEEQNRELLRWRCHRSTDVASQH